VSGRLCRLEDIPDGQARGFAVASGEHEVFVHRRGGSVRAFVNSCPHRGTPLDWVPDRFIAADGEHFLCATHGALFRLEDGFCVAGPCAGARLASVAVTVVAGWVELDAD
jgi:nitrite reductase/ring-hydroxylating ferredoxin subunit